MNSEEKRLEGFKSFQVGQSWQGNISRGEDLLLGLEETVKKLGISSGFVQVLGAVRSARLGYFDQEKMEYEYHEFDKPLEILHCMGNISLQDESPVIHAHIVLGDEESRAFGGHLARGTEVFVAETIIQEYKGEPQFRREDPRSGLTLWNF